MSVTKKKYFRRIMMVNIIVYTLCWAISFMSNYVPTFFIFLLVLLLIYAVLGIGMLLKYRIEKKYRKINANVKEYIRWDIISYVFFTFLSLTLFVSGKIGNEGFFIFIFFNILVFVTFLISIFNPLAKIWRRRSMEVRNTEFKKMVSELAKHMCIGDVDMGILSWKKLKIANAMQTGTKKSYVFISDYLFENLTLHENLAVVAHEFAHIKLGHIRKIQTFVFCVILGMAYSYFLPSILLKNNVMVNIIQLIGIWGGVIALTVFLTIIRRRFEKQADLFAAKYISPKYLISALNKLSDLNFMPKEVSRAWGLSHPSIDKRIKYLERYAMDKSSEVSK